MFGELDDSDIYENSPSGGFDGSSDANPEFAYDGNDSATDDFLDMSSFEEPVQPEDEQSGLLGVEQPQQDIPVEPNQEIDSLDNPQKTKRSSGLIYILLLGVLFIAAAGLFVYKKNMSQNDISSSEQSMGDYFYDKSSETASSQPQEQAPAGTATIDVDLTAAQPTQDSAVRPANETVNKTPVEKKSDKESPDKELSAIDKAMIKKMQDEARDSQVSLSTRPVIIPVTTAGRVDPFMPYGQREALANKPKFDIIAPPSTLPAADPIVDEMLDAKVSGIMYDSSRPSAIVKIGGADQLVHKGDVVKGCKILDITKNTVVIKYKANIYQTSVGQSLDEGVNLNTVSNIAKQFGGAYSSMPKNALQFNK